MNNLDHTMEDRIEKWDSLQVFENIPLGYAYHKVITDNDGNPIDYEFIAVNSLFELYTGLEKSLIIGKRITEAIPGITEDSFDWIRYYGDVAINGKSKQFENYSEALNKWYSVNVYSPQRNYFITFFTDISSLKEQALKMKESNEEYATLNEEYLSQNEELQSIMEELQDQRDKAQSNELLLNSIISSTDNAILVVNVKGKVIHTNKLFYKLWEVPESPGTEDIEKDLIQYISNKTNEPEGFISKVKKLYVSSESDHDCIHLIDGRIIESYSKPFIHDNKVLGRVWTFRDITEKERAQNKLTYVNSVLKGIRAINRIQSNVSSPKELISLACEQIQTAIGFEASWILLLNGNNKVKMSAVSGVDIKNNVLSSLITPSYKADCYRLCDLQGDISIMDKSAIDCNGCPLDGLCTEKSVMVAGIKYNRNFYGYITVILSSTMAKEKEITSLINEVADDIAFTLAKLELDENHSVFIEKLKDSESHLKSIFKVAPTGIGVVKDRVFSDVNDRFCEIIGYSRDEILGQKSTFLYTSRDEYEKVGKEKYDQINKYGTGTVETKFLHKDGRVIDILMSSTPFDQSDYTKGVTFTVLDISDRKQFEKSIKEKAEELQAAEEQLRAANDELYLLNITLEKNNKDLLRAKEKAEESDRLKSTFLANMSHEIRTPMNGMLGFAELMKNKKMTEEKRAKYANIINSNGQQLLRIIDDIIDISKIEANQLTINPLKTNLSKMLKELHDNFRTRLDETGKKHISLSIKKANDEEVYMEVDEIRLKQILSNLIGNAIKFTDDGSICFGYKQFENNGVQFFVSDTGVGIPKEKQDLVFERFRQADERSIRDYGGTGLGLTISKRLVEMMGGRIWLESKTDSGTIFYFTLPIARISRQNKVIVMDDKTNSINDFSKKIILIVEDNDTSYIYLESLLEETKAELIHAKSGEEAIEIFEKKEGIDLILMDIQLPGIDGLSTTKEIKKRNSEIPIIAQTAFAMSNDRIRCLDAGCNDYISKPISSKKLMCLLDKYISKSSSE